ncbi:MAG TPA: YihY/virulence factor BrkB family protein, partial [Chromatiales bacterium]|nr:YihY/virulence factor BrkB family protein [Chromatiales bacterium]
MRLELIAVHKKLFHLVWETPLESLPSWQQLLINIARVTHLIIRDLAEGQLTMRAMGLVYTTLLSMVPLLAVSFSVLKGFGVHNQVKPILLRLMEPLGEKGIEITNQIIGFVDNIKVGVLGSVGLALLFYTVISLLQKIERSFNYTWRVAEIRPLSQRFSDYLSVILIGPVLVFTAIGLMATVTGTTVFQALMEHPLLGWIYELVAYLLPYGIMTIAFSFIYVLFPNTRVKLSAAIVGGLVASILWQLSGWVFATFVVNSAKYTAIYSVFATLIIFLIWLYLNWLILLVGCSIAFYTQHGEYRNLRTRLVWLSNRVREKMGLYIMALVGRHHYRKQPPLRS